MNKENKSRNKRSEKNYAAIDIGSNAVRLLIKHINENSEKKFSKVLLLRVPLRLGFDVFSKGRISEKKEKNMKSAKKMEQKPVKQSVKREEPAPDKDKKEINALNEQMIELHHQGKSVLEISKILHVGQGEVQLILSLYDK